MLVNVKSCSLFQLTQNTPRRVDATVLTSRFDVDKPSTPGAFCVMSNLKVCGETNLYCFKKDKAGRVFAFNAGDYLLSPKEASSIISHLQNYLKHIEEESVISHNRGLMHQRQDEALYQKSSAKTPTPTFIYLIKNNRNGLYKIGRSKTPSIRESTLQSEEPDISMILSFAGTSQLEKELHKRFADKRVRGEWFELSGIDIEIIKTYR